MNLTGMDARCDCPLGEFYNSVIIIIVFINFLGQMVGHYPNN